LVNEAQLWRRFGSSGPVDIWLKRLELLVIQLLQALVTLSRPMKLLLLLPMDAALCVVAVWIAFSLRLGEWRLWDPAVATVIAVTLAFWLPVFVARRIYHSVIRFMGSRTMVDIAVSCLIIMSVLVALFTIGNVPGVPRTISFIHPLVFAALLMLSRLVARYILFDLLNQRRFIGRQDNVLIYGAGSAGRQLAVSLRHEPKMTLRGYIDDDIQLAGQHLDGFHIYHSSRIARVVERYNIDMILLAIPQVSRRERERIVRSFDGMKARVLTLPAMREIVDGAVSFSDLRQVEVTDLLGRDPVPPNQLLLNKTVIGKTVLVTGAGGSIGSELCRQIGKLRPSRLILLEMTEHALYTIETELREAQKSGTLCGSMEIIPELGSVTDKDMLRRLFDRVRPNTVFHAAAYKHVPLVEENALSGMRNNIFGTLNCALEAERAGTHNFILVSTDKAVRPTNIMGASKRVCELVLQARAALGGNTRFAMVRFGNVLGSSGSVVPRFQRQIQEGGPVTLTHRDVTRYFMTIPEAAQLVIQAGAMCEGGEVFVLDMGEPVRIYDLARTLINLSGLSIRDADNPDGDIEIAEIGLRRGEKLYEELLIGDRPRLTGHPQIMQARETFITWGNLAALLDTLALHLKTGDREGSVSILRALVPEYAGPVDKLAHDVKIVDAA
jgi:FlaA1/EpsC-like NDP-sugar epimerase